MKQLIARVLVLTIVATLAATPAAADTPFRKSITDAAVADAQTRAQARARADNPYKTPGIILLSAGIGLAALGLIFPSGVECSDVSTSRSFVVDCGTKANKGLLFGGLGAAGVAQVGRASLGH